MNKNSKIIISVSITTAMIMGFGVGLYFIFKPKIYSFGDRVNDYVDKEMYFLPTDPRDMTQEQYSYFVNKEWMTVIGISETYIY